MAEHRLALVVGATRGIGLGVTKALLDQGWHVIATARDPDRAADLHALETKASQRLTIARLDMNDASMIDGFGKVVGDSKLDTLLVNAGVAGPEHRSASAATAEEIGALMFTNAIAPIRLTRVLASRMRPDAGVVAFTSSVMGSVAQNTGGHELYRASKAALNSLTRGLWGELRDDKLTLLTLHPGWVRTEMGGASAAVSVEDSAAGIVTVIEQRRGAHEHRFLDYTGKEIPW